MDAGPDPRTPTRLSGRPITALMVLAVLAGGATRPVRAEAPPPAETAATGQEPPPARTVPGIPPRALATAVAG